MEKKYQVFVSSTYEDLQDERRYVSENLLKCDCIPVGMELFPSTNSTQWEFIKSLIDECDYYILILGGRYGTECKVNEYYRDDFNLLKSKQVSRSFTHHEYHYAKSKNIPIISFLCKDPEELKASKIEKTDHGKKLYSDFRKTVENNNRMCSYWSSPEELSLQVTVSINKLINSDPMPGWVRALDSATSGLVTSNLTRENEQLNKKIQRLELQLARNIDIIPNTPTLSSPNERQPTPKEFWNVRYSILQFRYRGRGFIQSSYSVNIDIEELKETVKSQIRQISSEGEVGDIIKKCVYSTTLKASTEITPLFPSPCGEYRKGDLQHLSVYPEDIYLIQSWLKDKQVYDTDENGYTILAPLLN